MRDDREERRQKDLRDLEFYRQRVKPSASELWRTLEQPRKSGESVLLRRSAGSRADSRLELTTPSSIAEVQAAMAGPPRGLPTREADESGAMRTEGDAIWPLVCALMVLAVLALTDSLDRVATALPF